MKRSTKRLATHARATWANQWRHVRRTMREPAEMAWRLKRVTWADTALGRVMWNAACDVAYSRAMAGHTRNRLGNILA